MYTEIFVSLLTAQSLPGDRDPTSVFSNNELDLANVDVYGFDYDYTLASYKPTLHYLIYSLGRDALVKDHNVGTVFEIKELYHVHAGCRFPS